MDTSLLVACLEKCPVSGAFTFNCQRERNETILILKACLQATQFEHDAAAQPSQQSRMWRKPTRTFRSQR